MGNEAGKGNQPPKAHSWAGHRRGRWAQSHWDPLRSCMENTQNCVLREGCGRLAPVANVPALPCLACRGRPPDAGNALMRRRELQELEMDAASLLQLPSPGGSRGAGMRYQQHQDRVT